jgi:cell division protein FtsL
MSNKDRYELVDEIDTVVSKDVNLSSSLLFLVFGFILLVVLLFAPKIYIQNNIYYESRKLNKLYVQYLSLKEENKNLKQQIEDKKFKNQILDSDIL